MNDEIRANTKANRGLGNTRKCQSEQGLGNTRKYQSEQGLGNTAAKINLGTR